VLIQKNYPVILQFLFRMMREFVLDHKPLYVDHWTIRINRYDVEFISE
jgi:hypothetical protein